MVLFAFGVGLANFASGRHLSPRNVVDSISEELPLVASYSSTGNVAVEDGNVDEIRRVLERVTGTAWAVVSARHLDDGLHALSALPAPKPTQPEGERATAGLAFAVNPAREGALESTTRAMLRRLDVDMVAVWKLDVLNGSRLDRDRRRGGWGAVSTDIGRQIGGRWTARSRRTLDGLRSRV
jgi:hypothetical protein